MIPADRAPGATPDQWGAPASREGADGAGTEGAVRERAPEGAAPEGAVGAVHEGAAPEVADPDSEGTPPVGAVPDAPVTPVSRLDRRQPVGQLQLLDEVVSNKAVQTYLALADQFTAQLGYTEHGFRHANLVGHIAFNILDRLGQDRHLAELAAVAGYLHDVGNVISRHNHPQTSALIAMPILAEMGLTTEDIGLVIGAIGNHEEELGNAVSPVAAAVVIADKSDVHRSRVRKDAQVEFDIHDRVNFSATHSFVRVDAGQRTVTLELEIDTEVSDILEYFEIFLARMMMCRRAAEGLDCKFRMTVNGHSLL